MTRIYKSYSHLIHRCADKIRLRKFPFITTLMAECFATTIFIFWGDGAGAQNFFSKGAYGGGFLMISLAWGAAVTTGILIGGKASPAIMNPAITLSNTIVGKLRFAYLLPFMLVEVLGGYLGAGLLLAVYRGKIIQHANEVDGGKFLVNTTGGIFVAGKGSSTDTAVTDQIVMTAILVFVITAVADGLLVKKPSKWTPFLVGMSVYTAVGTYTANASSALNPARDLGPRLLLLSTYWGTNAFTTDDYYFWVPSLMPLVGAIIGALVYEITIGIHVTGAGHPLAELAESQHEEDALSISNNNLSKKNSEYY